MAKKSEPAKPPSFHIYKVVAKAVLLGTVEAADEAEFIKKAAAEYKTPASKLIAVRR